MTEKEYTERRKAIFDNWKSIRQRDIDLDNLTRQAHEELKVGDGVTLRLYSDAEAYTVVKRTACSITVQRDKAMLDPNFKPVWDVGGFAGHCTNQEEQKYSYERNENGEKITLRFSRKYGRFMYLEKSIQIGRHEFYDYNF